MHEPFALEAIGERHQPAVGQSQNPRDRLQRRATALMLQAEEMLQRVID
jgi:hypothetical protein